MGKAKTFEPGQAVQVQRVPGGPWVPAKYRGESRWHIDPPARYHNVELAASEPERWIDSMTGIEWSPEDVAAMPSTDSTRHRLFRTRALSVPSRRIRAVRS